MTTVVALTLLCGGAMRVAADGETPLEPAPSNERQALIEQAMKLRERLDRARQRVEPIERQIEDAQRQEKSLSSRLDGYEQLIEQAQAELREAEYRRRVRQIDAEQTKNDVAVARADVLDPVLASAPVRAMRLAVDEASARRDAARARVMAALSQSPEYAEAEQSHNTVSQLLEQMRAVGGFEPADVAAAEQRQAELAAKLDSLRAQALSEDDAYTDADAAFREADDKLRKVMDKARLKASGDEAYRQAVREHEKALAAAEEARRREQDAQQKLLSARLRLELAPPSVQDVRRERRLLRSQIELLEQRRDEAQKAVAALEKQWIHVIRDIPAVRGEPGGGEASETKSPQ